MGVGQWLAAFRQLHERARRGELGEREKRVYDAGREELARALLAAQHVMMRPGQKPRQSLRVARALQVEVTLPGGKVRAVTMDVSVGGFGAVLGARPPEGTWDFSLKLPGGDLLAGTARVVDVRQLPGSVRVAFAFVEIAPADLARLELVVFDTVMSQLKE